MDYTNQAMKMTISSSTNEYLKLREEKMARNRSKLERLGLVGPYHTMSSSSDHPVSSTTTKNPPRPQKTRDISHHPKSNSEESIPMILRRSSRVKNVVSYEEGNLERMSLRKRESRTRYDDDDKDHYEHHQQQQRLHHYEELNKKNKKRRQQDSSNTHVTLSSMPIKVSTERTSELKPGTTRSVSISIVSTLYGNVNHPQHDDFQTSNTNNHHVSSFIGQYLSTPNKSAVIDHANYHSGNPPGISFNKYSGVCEFSNAIFLWVNIGMKEEAGMVLNEFLNGGRQVRRGVSPSVSLSVSPLSLFQMVTQYVSNILLLFMFVYEYR
jgi:hypothetical protein